MVLKLLVLRSPDPARLAQFYASLELTFEYHRHDNGPMHYSAQLNGIVLEIYPLAKGQTAPDPHLRLGLEVKQFEQVMDNLKEQGVKILKVPQETEFGWLSVVEDPDGRKVELYKV